MQGLYVTNITYPFNDDNNDDDNNNNNNNNNNNKLWSHRR